MSRIVKNLVLFVIVFHVAAFVVEAFLWMRPVVHEPMLRHLTGAVDVSPRDQAAILRSLFVNQGFYNLFLAIGTGVGVVGVARDWEPQGSTLVVFGCLFMIGAALVLVVARPRMARAAAIQGVLPLLALLAALIW